MKKSEEHGSSSIYPRIGIPLCTILLLFAYNFNAPCSKKEERMMRRWRRERRKSRMRRRRRREENKEKKVGKV